MIYAIDFDGTIVEDRFPEIGKLKPEAEQFIRELQRRGDKWILWTMRAGRYLNEAKEFLDKHGLSPDAANHNLPEVKAKWPSNPNPRKIFANVYIDDRNAGGLKFCDLNCPCDDPIPLKKLEFTPAQEKIIEKCNKLKLMLLGIQQGKRRGANPCPHRRQAEPHQKPSG